MGRADLQGAPRPTGVRQVARFIPTAGQKSRQPGEAGNVVPSLTISAGQEDGVEETSKA